MNSRATHDIAIAIKGSGLSKQQKFIARMVIIQLKWLKQTGNNMNSLAQTDLSKAIQSIHSAFKRVRGNNL